jgi:hypothetical protein
VTPCNDDAPPIQNRKNLGFALECLPDLFVDLRLALSLLSFRFQQIVTDIGVGFKF